MTKSELAKLKALRDTLTMDNSLFTGMGHYKVTPTWPYEKEPVTVQEATRLWRQILVLPVLDEIIAKYDPGYTAVLADLDAEVQA